MVAEVNELDPERKLIHLMDREADIYELISYQVRNNIRFINRVSCDRRLEPEQGAEGTRKAVAGSLFTELEKQKTRFTREVPISKRGKKRSKNDKRSHPPRNKRYGIRSRRYAECVCQ